MDKKVTFNVPSRINMYEVNYDSKKVVDIISIKVSSHVLQFKEKT